MSSLAHVLEVLGRPALTILQAQVSWAELIGDLTGGLCVFLVARQHVLNWPLGIINNVMWALLFWNAKLYADATLQLCFLMLGVYGWLHWTRGAAASGAALRVRRTTQREWLWLAGSAGASTSLLAWVLTAHTDSPAPLWDASVLTLSLVAIYGQTQKLLESWYLWIVVDAICVPLCLSRRLYPTAALYAVFACLCVFGLRSWRSAERAQSPSARQHT